MKKKIAALCVLSAFAISLSACGEKADTNESPNENQTDVSVSESLDTSVETEENARNTVSAEDTIVTTIETTKKEETETSREIPMIDGSDYAFSRKYVDKVYDIYLASQIVGQEARDEWVNNVLLVKSTEEQTEVPPLYQMIHDLNISKEDFVAKNAENIDSSGMYFSEDIISALYLEDIEEMKKQLVNPLALYYDDEIYTFDELSQSQNAQTAANIPVDVMSEYVEYIEMVCDESGILKYMQEEIDSVKKKYQLN